MRLSRAVTQNDTCGVLVGFARLDLVTGGAVGVTGESLRLAVWTPQANEVSANKTRKSAKGFISFRPLV